MPWCILSWGSFFPRGFSSSIPNHSPSANVVVPAKRMMPAESCAGLKCWRSQISPVMQTYFRYTKLWFIYWIYCIIQTTNVWTRTRIMFIPIFVSVGLHMLYYYTPTHGICATRLTRTWSPTLKFNASCDHDGVKITNPPSSHGHTVPKDMFNMNLTWTWHELKMNFNMSDHHSCS